jgi:hypothetical protein
MDVARREHSAAAPGCQMPAFMSTRPSPGDQETTARQDQAARNVATTWSSGTVRHVNRFARVFLPHEGSGHVLFRT